MARPRQAKKNRSSKPRVKTGTVGRTKAGKKKVNFLGNETIRQNWDRKLTLAQNYKNLGLSVKLKGRAGGTEKRVGAGIDTLAISSGVKVGKLAPGEIRVVRDADGKILEVIDPELHQSRDNPLSDPLNEIESDFDVDSGMDDADDAPKSRNPIVAQLEAQAAAELEDIERKKQPRKQSSREEEWIEKLVEKYGDDYSGMFRDKKLNPMQQSEGDIKRRVKKWQLAHVV